MHTTLGDDMEVNFDEVFLFVPLFIPDVQTQRFFLSQSKIALHYRLILGVQINKLFILNQNIKLI